MAKIELVLCIVVTNIV